MRVAALIALLAGAAIFSAEASPAPARTAFCSGGLPASGKIVTEYEKPYAIAYRKSVKVYVESDGPAMSDVHAELYTFDGVKLGESKDFGDFSVGATKRVKLRFPMQAGKFTLVIKGVAEGCSNERERSQVVRFHDCGSELPLKFPRRPGGQAADYAGYVSVPVRTDGVTIDDLRGTLSNFDGQFFGRSRLKVLFGTATMDNKLVRGLDAGRYSFTVDAFPDQPRKCGRKKTSVSLRFR